jgi:hypothetical protein
MGTRLTAGLWPLTCLGVDMSWIESVDVRCATVVAREKGAKKRAGARAMEGSGASRFQVVYAVAYAVNARVSSFA